MIKLVVFWQKTAYLTFQIAKYIPIAHMYNQSLHLRELAKVSLNMIKLHFCSVSTIYF